MRVFDSINRICFLIDNGLTISTIQATSRDTSRNPDNQVLRSATANEIQTYGEKVQCLIVILVLNAFIRGVLLKLI